MTVPKSVDPPGFVREQLEFAADSRPSGETPCGGAVAAGDCRVSFTGSSARPRPVPQAGDPTTEAATKRHPYPPAVRQRVSMPSRAPTSLRGERKRDQMGAGGA